MSKQLNIPTLKVVMKDCCCYTCGAGSVETYEKENTGYIYATNEPIYEYRKYEWHSLNDFDKARYFENVAWTAKDNWGQKSLVANDGDSEDITKEEYEVNKCVI